MSFAVFLTDDASRDVTELYDYITRHDAAEKAPYVLDRIEQAVNSLADQPHRGTYPAELLELGIRDFREVFFKPYRIIYRVMDERVYVLLIADGRRDMQTLLQRRLLQA